jgi:undecaprenyl-phosphate 4-deoxy-4-formamido-L-arabinose transferase
MVEGGTRKLDAAAKGKDPVLSVVIPVFNEEENLDELVERLVRTCDALERSYEIILVDDGSRDRSPERIQAAIQKHPGKFVGVFLNRNYGQHAAVIAGFSHVRGQVVVTLDADLQNPPEEITQLVQTMDQGYDVVGSVRVPRHDSLFRRLSSHLVNKMVRQATGVMMHDYGCMLRAYRRPIVDAMLRCREQSTFVPVLANGFARRTAEVEVKHAPRTRGESKYPFMKLVHLQFDLLTSMTTFPLRMLSFIGGAISLAGFGFGLLLLVLRLILGPGWAVGGIFTLFAIVFIFIGAQFVGMGLMGEYLGRVYYDVRARPRYLVERVAGRPDLDASS